MGLLLVFPGLPGPPLEDIPKKEEATKSYTFRFDDRRSLKNTDEGESSVPVRVLTQDARDTRDTKRMREVAGTETRTGRDLERGGLDVERMDVVTE